MDRIDALTAQVIDVADRGMIVVRSSEPLPPEEMARLRTSILNQCGKRVLVLNVTGDETVEALSADAVEKMGLAPALRKS